MDDSEESENATVIKLEGSIASEEGRGAEVNGSTITIKAAGFYSISGTLNDGQIIVDSQDIEKVKLVLESVTITSSTNAPIYVKNAEKTIITLAEGSVNTINDGTSYILENEGSGEPNATIFRHDDLTINGSDSLTVNASYNNGIASKDDLKINGGNIIVNDGIKGEDSISIKDCIATISAGGDGVQATNTNEAK